jgi:hypothetical protein
MENTEKMNIKKSMKNGRKRGRSQEEKVKRVKRKEKINTKSVLSINSLCVTK